MYKNYIILEVTFKFSYVMYYSCIVYSLTVVVGVFDLKRWLKCRLVLKMIGDKNCSTCKVKISLQRLFRTYI